MTNFNLGALASWQEIAMGEVLEISCPDNGVRSVQFELIADDHISVHVAYEDTSYLVAAGMGQLSVKFAIDRRCGMSIQGAADAVVFMRSHVETQVISESLDESFTSIEPARVGPSDDMRRMMEMVRLNNLRRDQQLAQERAEMAARYETKLAEVRAATAPPAAPVTPSAPSEVIE